MHRGNRVPFSRRQTDEVRAARIATVLDGPDAQQAFEQVRLNIIRDLESVKLDGSPEAERHALELVRRLQCFLQFKTELIRPLINARLKERREDLSENGE